MFQPRGAEGIRAGTPVGSRHQSAVAVDEFLFRAPGRCVDFGFARDLPEGLSELRNNVRAVPHHVQAAATLRPLRPKVATTMCPPGISPRRAAVT